MSAQHGGKLDVAITRVYVPFVRGPLLILTVWIGCATSKEEAIPPPDPDPCIADGRDPAAHRALALKAAEMGDDEGSITHYRCALTLDPSSAETRIELAVQLLGMERWQEARAELSKAHETASPDVRSRSLLASALEGLGDLRAAADELARAAEETKTSAVLYRRAATLYTRAGDDDRAAEMKAKADEIDPPPPPRELRELPPARDPPKRKTKKKRR